jgi:hypothetical protein
MWDFRETVFLGVMERLAPILKATFRERRELKRWRRRRHVEPVLRDELQFLRLGHGSLQAPSHPQPPGCNVTDRRRALLA